MNQSSWVLGENLQIAQVAQDLVLLGARLASSTSRTSSTRFTGFARLVFHLRLESLHLLAGSLCSFFLGFGLFDFADSAFDGGITLAKQVSSLGIGFFDDRTFLGFDACQLLLIVCNLLLEVFLALTDILSFILPVAFIARNVLQVFIVVDMLLAHNIRSTLDNRFGQTNLASNLHSKTTTCLTNRDLEERFELSAVVEHGTIDNTFGTLS